MGKLKGYLKPFLGGLIVTVMLLFVQAFSDLNLPNYMSEIVNVGIQQNGVEHAAPDAISTQGFELVSTFLTDSEKLILSDNYALVSPTDSNGAGKTYQSIYPNAQPTFYAKKSLIRRHRSVG